MMWGFHNSSQYKTHLFLATTAQPEAPHDTMSHFREDKLYNEKQDAENCERGRKTEPLL